MSLRNGSAEFKFSEVLPIVKDHAVFNVSNYASKITGGSNKTKKRKYKGGHIPLVFSEFKTGTVITTENPIVIAALNGPTLPEITQTPISTTPSISLGGGAAKRRSRKSKRIYKRGGKKSDKKSVKKSNKKTDKK